MDFQNDAPIIQKLTGFYKELNVAVEKMPKKDKYTLGAESLKITLDVMELAFAAGSVNKSQKLPYLVKANSKNDVLKRLISLANQVHAITPKTYIRLEEILQETGRMLGGWIKSVSPEHSA